MVKLFQVFFPTSILALFLSEAALVCGCYVAGCYLGYPWDPTFYLLYDGGLASIGVVAFTLLLGFYYQDLYTDLRKQSRVLLVQQVCLSLGMAFLIQALLNYSKTPLYLSRWVMVSGSLLVLFAVPIWRTVFGRYVLQALGSSKVLFLGSNQAVQDLVRHYRSRPEIGFSPIGYLAESSTQPGIPDCPRLGTISDLPAVVADTRPARIVVGLTDRRSQLPFNELLELRFRGVAIDESSRAYETAFARINLKELRPSELVFSSELGPRPLNLTLQTMYCWVIALIGVVLTLPLMVLVAALVRLTSPGPALFRQVRVGKDDRPFTLFKFRSMRNDAEAATGAVWAQRNDPRVTPLGKWLRKLRLDELPQLFNVLKGEMSIVGPRPERPEFVQKLEAEIPFYRQRHCVKPGITGWAQINHKYGDTLEDTITKLEYDLYYIKNMAPALDFYIMFQTAKVMLLSRGAQ